MPFHSFNNSELFYKTFGQGDTALLFIHGLFGESGSWKYQIDKFSDKYEVVAVDLFGHGLSSKDIDPVFVPRLDAEAIYDLMKNRISKPYYAIGHSFASAILPEIIKLDNTLLRKAVFVDCTYQGDREVVAMRAKFAENMLGLDDKAIKPEAEYWYKSLIGDKAAPEDIELILSSFRKGDCRWMFQSVAGCRPFNEKYPPDKTPIRDYQKIMIMEAGTGIGLDFRKSWVNHFKSAEYYLFERTGHFFFITEHERFNTILAEFLEEK